MRPTSVRLSHKVLGSYLLIVIAARVRQPVREINAHAHESGHNRCSWTIRNERPACVLRSPTRLACNGLACSAPRSILEMGVARARVEFSVHTGSRIDSLIVVAAKH